MADTESPAELIRAAVLGPELVRAVLSGAQSGARLPWLRVQVRPVLVRGRRLLQFSYFDARRDISKNYAEAEAAERLEELIAAGYRNVHLSTESEQIQINVSAKGRPVIGRTRAAGAAAPLSHNRRKQLLLPEGSPDAFLVGVGIMSADGSVRPSMHDKHRQINEFLKIVDQTLRDQPPPDRPLTIVDFGCGNAYLSFAAYHYLAHLRGLPARLVGVDLKSELVQRNNELAQQLGWADVSFMTGRIIEALPDGQADMVIALHACDTATDEALAQALRLEARYIFSAPCCHHHLQAQLAGRPAPAPFQPLMRHGIMSERMGDLLTDALRASTLRILGYATDVIQFVSSEHTARNLMIRAVRSARAGERRFVEEYRALAGFWGVTPHLETLLDAPARALLAAEPAEGAVADG